MLEEISKNNNLSFHLRKIEAQLDVKLKSGVGVQAHKHSKILRMEKMTLERESAVRKIVT